MDKRFDLGDKEHNNEGEVAVRLRLPVSGPTGKGHYFLLAEKRVGDDSDGPELVRSDLEMDETESLLPEQFAGKKMVIYAKERHGDIKSFVGGGDKAGNANGST